MKIGGAKAGVFWVKERAWKQYVQSLVSESHQVKITQKSKISWTSCIPKEKMEKFLFFNKQVFLYL